MILDGRFGRAESFDAQLAAGVGAVAHEGRGGVEQLGAFEQVGELVAVAEAGGVGVGAVFALAPPGEPRGLEEAAGDAAGEDAGWAAEGEHEAAQGERDAAVEAEVRELVREHGGEVRVGEERAVDVEHVADDEGVEVGRVDHVDAPRRAAARGEQGEGVGDCVVFARRGPRAPSPKRSSAPPGTPASASGESASGPTDT
jgi:hypothetical protein